MDSRSKPDDWVVMCFEIVLQTFESLDLPMKVDEYNIS